MSIFNEIGMYHYLILALMLFCIGFWGVIVCRNVIRVMICLGIMLNAVAINFITFGVFVDSQNLHGLVFSLFIAIFCAVEIALGAVILVSVYKYKKSCDTQKITDIRG